MLGTKEQEKINLPGHQRAALTKAGSMYDLLERTPTYPGQMVAPLTESEQTAQRLATGYAFNERPLGMQHGAENTLMNMLSGSYDTGPGTPYDTARQARRSRATRSLQEDVLPGIRQGIVEYQPGGGSEGNQVQALALARQQQTLDELDAEMELEAMRTANQRQQAGMGMYPGIMNTPIDFYGRTMQMAQPERKVQQQMLTADKAAYDERRANAIANLGAYTGAIGDVTNTFSGLQQLKDAGLLG
jgi:hypothetical protein|tara:strand:- start:5310 stop:6044 length:735 start_codon:yes stop_codon:yes gene_type:complete